MKKTLSLILTFVFVIGVCFSAPFKLKANAASVTDLTFELNNDNQSYYVSDCDTSASGEIIIPSTYNGLPVTSIGYCAFRDCTSLTSVIIPDSVKRIGDSAFYGCTSLTCVTIPDGVTSIGMHAFRGCSSLTGITIPDGVTSIGSCTFFDCSSLTSVTIPGSVTSINNYAFYNCSALTSVHITNLASWCNINFENRYSNPLCHGYYNNGNLYLNGELVTVVTIPEGVTEIKNYAFEGCSSLISVTIPDSVTSIGSSAFDGCSSLTSITIPDGVTSIGSCTFYHCFSLTSVTIPDSVTSIGGSAFYGCSSLTSITIPDGVTSIGYSAFRGCSSLTGITIPDSVTSISDHAFEGCSSLASITIPDCVTSIGDHAFGGCSSLTSITIPDGVTSIGYFAFCGCSSLTSITIPDGVTSMGSSAFNGCSSLTSVTIPVGVTSIGSSAFDGCSSLTSITIPDGVTSIGDSAFDGCSSLTGVHITNLASWCNIDFANSTSNPLCNGTDLHLNGELVTELAIPEGITEIKNYAFYGCSSLTGVTIPVGVTSIGSSAFDGCSSLSSITIPDSVTSIGDDVFYNCSALTSVHITNLASWCNINFENRYSNPLCHGYYNNGNLYLNGELVTVVTIPEGVTEIKNYAFEGCSSLISVTIPDSVTSIGSSAFYGCSSLTNVTIPDSVTSISYSAFVYCPALKYVFYTSSPTDWDNIFIDSNNSSLTSAVIHYNATDHTHNITTQFPSSEGMEGLIEDICPVCQLVFKQETLVYINDYITAIDTKNVVVDTTNNTLILDISACKDINDALIEMDGYTLTTTTNSNYGYYGTGSKVQVTDSTGAQVAEYTLVVRGDVNGDSVCDVLDLMLIELARTNNRNLDGVYLTAGDLTENGEIDVDDFEAVVNKAKGI